MMKKHFLFFLCVGLILSLSLTQMDKQLYQVRTSHPHDLEELSPYIETVHQSGRLWIVDLKPDTPKHLQNHLTPISGLEKSYLYLYDQPKSRDLTTSLEELEIEEILGRLDAGRIRSEVEHLTQYKTRAAGTTDNRAATQSVEIKLKELGLQVKRICYKEGVCSIVADKIGSVKSNEVLIILAHLDSVGKEFAGADDNASGTAVLLEMARVLKDYDNRSTFRFLVTNGEELGLLGSEHYVETLKKEDQIKQVALAINMDMVGYNKNGIVELETDPEYESWARWFAQLAQRYTSLRTKITLSAWGSDHVPFLKAGVPALLTIEDWSTKTPCYHTACDLPETLNYEYAAQIARLNVAALMSRDLQ